MICNYSVRQCDVCHSFKICMLSNSTTRRLSLSLTHDHRLVLIRKITLKTLDTSIGSTSPRCLMLIDGLAKILVTSYISSKEQGKKRPQKEISCMLRWDFARRFPLFAYSCHPPAPFDVVSMPRALAASKRLLPPTFV